jgi:hypothetical protein
MATAPSDLIIAATAAGATVIRAPGSTIIIVTERASDGDDLMPIAEAAALVRVSTPVLAKAGRNGELEVFGKQRSRVVRRADVLKWKASQRLRLVGPDDLDLARRIKRLETRRSA